ncbi:beta-ketoacyl-[acyl-carrier-protein] synthase family protein [Streptomyces sp. RM99]|uniref:beta-ketoacyl-[acyl-carrier-protein] synthase family protein n=1 Tax=Streptomyces sp. NPDC057387 TaxID=3346115 RepID=UPI001413C741|nr:beta-ketoacyl-[acyl-carrier-protein] synthase family protein [Streptomyces sp. RT42]MBQ0911435.1 beta-ketoacyl-[acyl-carrier-protein] synthase family protein [Streptomyces sp. RM99]MCC8340459.1 beta-ketoacyl-[acyl-carrier-protein] synthase family protein [Streptomyces sp. R1]QIP73542.1 beta-ketoacyl-[acyl-carrier-protein] synthase family protein [Streptomyces sp. VN1]
MSGGGLPLEQHPARSQGVSRHVVITGLSVLAPGSTDTEGFWKMITAGRSAIRRITAFDPTPFRSQVAGEIDLDPLACGFSRREVRRLDRASLLAVACARRAVAEAGITSGTSIDPGRIGVSVGNAVGSATSIENEYVVLSDEGRQWLVDQKYQSPHLFDYFVPGSLARETAWAAGAEGPVSVISAGCTSGIDALGHACQLIQEGSADVMVAGATDAPVTPIAVACFDAIKATTRRNDDPEHAPRPFDRTRDGFAIAEGAAMLVLEDSEHARRRGADIYGTITGYAAHSNAYHMTGLSRDGNEMARAITTALDEARTDSTAVGYINAHGSGTKQNDLHETEAFKKALGEHAYNVPVSSIKSMIGHSLGAIGAIEVATCALAIRNGVVPPTANLHEPDPDCDLDYVPLEARDVDLDVVLTVGSGFGGFQSAMVVEKWRGGHV